MHSECELQAKLKRLVIKLNFLTKKYGDISIEFFDKRTEQWRAVIVKPNKSEDARQVSILSVSDLLININLQFMFIYLWSAWYSSQIDDAEGNSWQIA